MPVGCDTSSVVPRGELHETTLYRAAHAVGAQTDLHEIVQVVTDESTALTGAQIGAFFYDGESYSLSAVSGVLTPLDPELIRPTFTGRDTIRLDDATAATDDPAFGVLPVRSFLAVPVISPAGDVVGGLFFGHERVGAFTTEHERLAEGIATYAGLAIEKAGLLVAERAARAEAEARADAAIALEVVDDGVVMVDAQGVVRLWNRAAEAITGLRTEGVLGRPIGHAVPGWERIALAVPVGEPDAATTPATLPLDTLAGREVWLSLYGVAFEGGTVYAFRDVTGQRELESLRSDVIATVSHELRTPIAAVFGAVQTLRGRELERPMADALLEIIDNESVRLAALVEEILLTSQLDSDTVRLARARVDPVAAIEGATQGFDAARIEFDVEEPLAPAAADPEKVRQVLSNFVENAFKYGDPPVTVRARAVRDAIRFEVVDRGPGIPRAEQQRIFEKFYRLDPHMTQGVRGTGLGLYICRELVHRMQGRIGVESVEGRGATFWVELPRQ